MTLKEFMRETAKDYKQGIIGFVLGLIAGGVLWNLDRLVP